MCGEDIAARYRKTGVDYYYCSKCDFLQNFYWEESESPREEKINVNDELRAKRWPAGEKDEMYKLGRGMFDFMASPIAWKSRKIHHLLKQLVPGYLEWNKKYTKNKLPRLMDYGCGHGLSVSEMRKRDGLDIIGLDPYSPTDSPYIVREELSVKHFPDNFFDGIFSVETIEHIPNVLEVFVELHRILKKGGVLLLQTSRLEDPKHIAEQGDWFYLRDPQSHVSIFSESAMRLIAKKTDFSEIDFRGVRYARFVK